MASPADISATVGQHVSYNWFGVVAQVFVWVGYFLLFALCCAAVFLLYLWFMNKYKVRYIDLRGTELDIIDGKIQHPRGEMFDVKSRIKKERAQVIKGKDKVTKWRLLFCRKIIPPVNMQYISERNEVNMIRTADDTFLPCVLERKFVVGNHVLEHYLPIESDIKLWQQTESQKIAMETRPDGFLQRMQTITIIWMVVLILFTAAVIYFNIQNAQLTVEKIDFVGSQLQSLNTLVAK